MEDEVSVNDALGKMEERLMARFEKAIEKVGDKRRSKEPEEEKPPNVTQKGIQKNINFNVKIANKLRKATGSEDPEAINSIVKEVLDDLKVRNGELVLLDADPTLLHTKEKLEALKALGTECSSGSANDMTSLLLLSQLGAPKAQAPARSDGKRKRYASPNRWFRSESFSRGHGGARQYGGQDTRSAERQSGATRCYKCQGYGHYANYCLQRRN